MGGSDDPEPMAAQTSLAKIAFWRRAALGRAAIAEVDLVMPPVVLQPWRRRQLVEPHEPPPLRASCGAHAHTAGVPKRFPCGDA